MKCHELEKYFESWHQGTAPSDVVRHLADCVGCSARANAAAGTAAWLALLRREPPQLSPGFWVRFWERQQTSAAEFWEALALLARRASLVLGVAVVLLLAGFLLQGGQEPPRAVLEAPQPYWAGASGEADAAGQTLDREQVVLTLVSRVE